MSLLSERQQLAIEAGGVALWEWKTESDRVIWSGQFYELHGLPPGSFEGTMTEFINLIHVEDAERVRTAFQQARPRRLQRERSKY